jgi:hypothetical protein
MALMDMRERSLACAAWTPFGPEASCPVLGHPAFNSGNSCW